MQCCFKEALELSGPGRSMAVEVYHWHDDGNKEIMQWHAVWLGSARLAPGADKGASKLWLCDLMGALWPTIKIDERCFNCRTSLTLPGKSVKRASPNCASIRQTFTSYVQLIFSVSKVSNFSVLHCLKAWATLFYSLLFIKMIVPYVI